MRPYFKSNISEMEKAVEINLGEGKDLSEFEESLRIHKNENMNSEKETDIIFTIILLLKIHK